MIRRGHFLNDSFTWIRSILRRSQGYQKFKTGKALQIATTYFYWRMPRILSIRQGDSEEVSFLRLLYSYKSMAVKYLDFAIGPHRHDMKPLLVMTCSGDNFILLVAYSLINNVFDSEGLVRDRS